jgi:hypothetical protein
MGDRFISWVYAIKSFILGIDVSSSTQLPVTYAGDTTTKVYDSTDKGPRPILIRIQNLGTEPIRWSEGMGTCTALNFSGIIPGSTVEDDGSGGGIEFQRHRPTNIYIHADDDYRCVIVKRYAYEN